MKRFFGRIEIRNECLHLTVKVEMYAYIFIYILSNGYPCGLAKEEIPLETRIMALADVFDALVSKRVYKEKFGYDKAFSIIEESSGSHFDPSLCRAFLQCRLLIETLYNSNLD